MSVELEIHVKWINDYKIFKATHFSIFHLMEIIDKLTRNYFIKFIDFVKHSNIFLSWTLNAKFFSDF